MPANLPPIDAWAVDPYRLNRFYVPADDRNIVLIDATVEAVHSLFDPDYIWPMDASSPIQQLHPDDHHFHWYARLYEDKRVGPKSASIPAQFRDLPSRRGILPRQFHEVIHKITLPPNVPKFEYMEQYLRDYAIARQLFESAKILRHLEDEAMQTLEDEKMVNQFERKFDGYLKIVKTEPVFRTMEQVYEIDPERLIDYRSVITHLAHHALFKHRNLTDYFTDEAAQEDAA